MYRLETHNCKGVIKRFTGFQGGCKPSSAKDKDKDWFKVTEIKQMQFGSF